jgi:hypothetical protein
MTPPAPRPSGPTPGAGRGEDPRAAARRAEAEAALRHAAEHGAVGDSFLATVRSGDGDRNGGGSDPGGDRVDRLGRRIGRALAILAALVVLWHLFGGSPPV